MSKLTSTTFKTPQQAATASVNTNVISSKPKINIQISSLTAQAVAASSSIPASNIPLPAHIPPSSFDMQHYQSYYNNLIPSQKIPPKTAPSTFKPPHVPQASNSMPVKRDSSGNLINKTGHNLSATTSNASNVKKQKDNHGNQAKTNNQSNDQQQNDNNKKKKKFVRCAAGEVWEDESLADWDPGIF